MAKTYRRHVGALETALIFEVPCTIVTPRRARAVAPATLASRQRANRVPAGQQLAHQMAALLPVAPVTSTFNLPDMSFSNSVMMNL